MFEENRNNIDQDLMFRSILEEGTEPAPAHVWDRIEEDLDRIARRRRTVLWFKSTAIGAAAAAILALGLFVSHETSEDIVSPAVNDGMIAVVEPETTGYDSSGLPAAETPHMQSLVAMADMPAVQADEKGYVPEAPEEAETHQEAEAHAEAVIQPEAESRQEEEVRKTEEEASEDKSDLWSTDIWPEEEKERSHRRTSLVLSGITGTNSSQNSNRVNPMRRPGISAAPQKTGIKETSTNTTYGIPVSAGAGVKIDIAPRWSISAGLNYTLLTRKFFGTYTSVGTNGSIHQDISSDIRNSQHYIGIPVNVYYDIVSRDQINLYAYAGGAVEKCVADKYQVLSTSITHKENVKGVQLSTDIGIGVEFLMGNHLGLYLDPSLRYYFSCSQPKSIRTAQPLMFGFEMGLRVRLQTR